MSILIKNGTIINDSEFLNADILIENSKITKIEKNIDVKADKVIDAKGLHISPGLVDLHVHLREPGFEYKEDIQSGTKACAKGGFTSIACMPNTNPVCDNVTVVNYIKNKAKEAGYTKVLPIGAITKGSKGKELAELYKMKKEGIVAASDDGRPVENSAMMRNALDYAKGIDLLLISHCEDLDLAKGGLVNEGYNATSCGLAGISRVSEELMAAREILLAEALDTRIHLAHMSTKGSVEMIRNAKARGVKVTAETCPHYFTLNDECILSFNPNTKVNPPIREEEDRLAIIEGIKDGTLDIIVTDHAPHHINDKNVEYALAANGISGIETSFALSYTYLVDKGYIDIFKLIEIMSKKPSEIINIEQGIKVGNTADIAIFDLNKEYEIKADEFLSKGKNTPFDGFKVKGSVEYTIIDGQLVLDKGQIL